VSDSTELGPIPPELEDPAERALISAQLAELIPEVRKLRRSRRLAWGWRALSAMVIVLAAAGVAQYVQDRNDDREQRAEVRKADQAALEAVRKSTERALATECESSVAETARTRTAIQVILTTAVARSSNPEATQAIADEINRRLDEDVPPRDCAQEARDRAEGG
jgi:hypothetical protein